MDDEKIAVSVLSLTAPGIEGWKGDAWIYIARRVNDYGARLMEQRPDRFVYFSMLAFPNVNAAVSEIERSMDVLHVDGVTLHSTMTESICQIRASILSGESSNGDQRPSSSIQPGRLNCLYCRARRALSQVIRQIPPVAPWTWSSRDIASAWHPPKSSCLMAADILPLPPPGSQSSGLWQGSLSRRHHDGHKELLLRHGSRRAERHSQPDRNRSCGTDRLRHGLSICVRKVSKIFDSNLDHATILTPDQVGQINMRAAELIPRL